MLPNRLVALDFSGTLSLGACLFGRDETLLAELRAAGLDRFGVSDVGAFWEQVINPTWPEGSTTSKGYRRLLFERIRALAPEQADEARLREAVDRFAARYFAHSTIDPAWQGVLLGLARQLALHVVIATDHYAEATEHILQQLAAWGIAGERAFQPGGAERVLVANSADAGHPKASARFWELLRQARDLQALDTIALVDDFGANEQLRDAYADAQRVAERMERTVALLGQVFGARVAAFPFVLGPRRAEATEGELLRAYRLLVEQAERFLTRELALSTP
jgi:hypothetical protein